MGSELHSIKLLPKTEDIKNQENNKRLIDELAREKSENTKLKAEIARNAENAEATKNAWAARLRMKNGELEDSQTQVDELKTVIEEKSEAIDQLKNQVAELERKNKK